MGTGGDRDGIHRKPVHVRRLRICRRRSSSALWDQFLSRRFVRQSAFAIGGLIYSLSVRGLVNRLGQIGLVTGGGALLALAYATIAFAPHAYMAPTIGLGYYMLH